jgi:hypothetical protein
MVPWGDDLSANALPIRRLAALGLLIVALLLPLHAAAQEPLSIVSNATRFDPSIQTAGMGSASVAVFWLDEPNEWGNPAALGSVHGIRYVYGNTDLTPLVLDFDELESERLLVGAFGVGVSLGGKGLEALRGTRLGYGERTVTDGLGNSFRFTPYERVRSLAVGVSVLDLLSNTVQVFGGDPIGIRDRIFISVGHTWKDLFAGMGFDPTFGQPVSGEGESLDRGALVRIAPLDKIGNTLGEPRESAAVRIELGGAYLERNYVEQDPEDVVLVLEQEKVYGASGRITVALSAPIARGWFWDFATPSIGIAGAWEQTEGESPSLGGFDYRRVRFGGELSILDLLTVRHGRIERDPTGIEGETWGVGLALQYRKAVGVRFDWTRVPWSEESGELDRYGVTAYLDLLKFDSSGGLAPRD